MLSPVFIKWNPSLPSSPFSWETHPMIKEAKAHNERVNPSKFQFFFFIHLALGPATFHRLWPALTWLLSNGGWEASAACQWWGAFPTLVLGPGSWELCPYHHHFPQPPAAWVHLPACLCVATVSPCSWRVGRCRSGMVWLEAIQPWHSSSLPGFIQHKHSQNLPALWAGSSSSMGQVWPVGHRLPTPDSVCLNYLLLYRWW